MRPDATPQRAAHEAAGLEDTATDLRHLSVEELTARLASRAPIPGGGSAAAIAGAMGAALVGMVAELTIGRPDSEPHATELAAAEAPLHAARLAVATLELASRIAPIGNPNAASDAGVAAQLASAAVRGAALNVRINLPYLPAGAELRDTAPAELAQLEARANEVERRTVVEVNRRIGPS